MKKYVVPFQIVFSGEITVEAESKAQAIETGKEINGFSTSEYVGGLKQKNVSDYLLKNHSTETKLGMVYLQKK